MQAGQRLNELASGGMQICDSCTCWSMPRPGLEIHEHKCEPKFSPVVFLQYQASSSLQRSCNWPETVLTNKLHLPLTHTEIRIPVETLWLSWIQVPSTTAEHRACHSVYDQPQMRYQIAKRGTKECHSHLHSPGAKCQNAICHPRIRLIRYSVPKDQHKYSQLHNTKFNSP